MPSDVKLFRVFIASPGDVANERDIAQSVIKDWNSVHCDIQNVVLLSKRWETDVTPTLKLDGQQVVNGKLVDKCDILIGIFWQSLGTPTNRAASGTVEEIERVRNSGKPCLIYFSDQPVPPSKFNSDEYKRVCDYKEQLKKEGLIGDSENTDQFERKLSNDLARAIQEIITREPIAPDLVGLNLEENSGETKNEEQKTKRTNRRVQEVLERGSTRKIDLIVDSALYIAYSKYTYKDDLKTRIRADQPISTKYLYFTDEGYNQWLEACRDPNYTFYSNSVRNLGSEIQEIINEAVRVNESPEFDFISLGSGNGEKDKIILRAMCSKLSQNQKVYYYPIDISDPMIVEAVRNSMKDFEFREKVDVKAIIGDMTNLKPLEFIYEERPCKNFFSILGNTIGNTDEITIINSINKAMREGDLVFIEINLDQASLESGYTFYKDEISMRSHFVPLKSLGVKFDRKEMEYIVAPFRDVLSDSIIPETKTLHVKYKKANIYGEEVSNILLISVHHYKLECFRKKIEETLRVQTIYQSANNNVGLILAQRKSS